MISRSHCRKIARLLFAFCLIVLEGVETEKSDFSCRTSNSNSAIIVVTLDGTVYTLDPWSGKAQGGFTSGGPLVSSSTKFEVPNGVLDGTNGSGDMIGNSIVVPGLDGMIYILDRAGKLEVFPSTAPDLVFEPIIACTNDWCGLLVGEKRTKIFALKPNSGEVEWILENGQVSSAPEEEETGEATSHLPREKVLLQRDDYLIRAVSTSTGIEHWNVTLGHFKALDTHDQAQAKVPSGFLEPPPEQEGDFVAADGRGSGGGEKELSTSVDQCGWNAGSGQSFPSVVWYPDNRLVATQAGRVVWEKRLPSLPIQAYAMVGEQLVDIDAMMAPELNLPPGTEDFAEDLDGYYLNENIPEIAEQLVQSQEEQLMLSLNNPMGGKAASKLGFKDGQFFVTGFDRRRYNAQHTQQMLPDGSETMGNSLENYLGSPELQAQTEKMRQIADGEKPLFEKTALLGAPDLPSAAPVPLLPRNPSADSFQDVGTDGSQVQAQALYLTWDLIFLILLALVAICGVVGLAAFKYGMGSKSASKGKRMEFSLPATPDLRGHSLSEEVQDLSSPVSNFTRSISMPFFNRVNWGRGNTPQQNASTGTCLKPQPLPRFTPSPTEMEDKEFFPPEAENAEQTLTLKTPPCKHKHPLAASISNSSISAQPVDDHGFQLSPKHESDYREQVLSGKRKDYEGSPHSPPRKHLHTDAKNSLNTTSDDQQSPECRALCPAGVLHEDKLDTQDVEKARSRDDSNVSQHCEKAVKELQLILGSSTSSRYASEFTEKEALGRGGFGTVHRATNRLDGHDYAIKKIWLSSSPVWRSKLDKVLREVKILALLDHTNIVRYYQAWLEQVKNPEIKQTLDDSNYSFNQMTGMDTISVYRSAQVAGTKLTNRPGGVDSRKIAPRHRSKRHSAVQSLMSYGPSSAMSDSEVASQHLEADLPKAHLSKSESETEREPFPSISNRSSMSSLSDWSEMASMDPGDAPRFQRGRSFSDYSATGTNLWKGSKGRPERSMTLPEQRPMNHRSTGCPQESLAYLEDDGLGFIWEKPEDSQTQSQSQSTSLSPSNSRGFSHNQSETASGRKFRQYGHSFNSTEDQIEQTSIRRTRKTRKPVEYDLLLYIQMQMCSQDTLQNFLQKPDRQQSVDIAHCLEYFLQIADGLRYVHGCGLIHRDLKPSNCFLLDNNIVKIGDFGLSRHIDTQAAAQNSPLRNLPVIESSQATPHFLSSSTTPEQVYADSSGVTSGVGTYLYASPEQMHGRDYNDKTDIYSLGIILFEMCHPAFSTNMERVHVLSALRAGRLPSTWQSTEKDLQDLTNLMLQMVEKEPDKRPKAADVVKRVEFYMGHNVVLSLKHNNRSDNTVVIRVEAPETQEILQKTVNTIKSLIQKGGNGGDLEQYAFRKYADKSVMEFLMNGVQEEQLLKIVEAVTSLPDVVSAKRVKYSQKY